MDILIGFVFGSVLSNIIKPSEQHGGTLSDEKRMHISSHSYIWPVYRHTKKNRNYKIIYKKGEKQRRGDLIGDHFNFMETYMWDGYLAEVPGISKEVAATLADKDIKFLSNLHGLAMTKMHPDVVMGKDSDVREERLRESIRLFMAELVENYNTIDDLGLISESIWGHLVFNLINPQLLQNKFKAKTLYLPSSKWFEDTGKSVLASYNNERRRATVMAVSKHGLRGLARQNIRRNIDSYLDL